MPPIVIPDACRVSFEWAVDNSTLRAVNVMHFNLVSPGLTAQNELVRLIGVALQDNMFTWVSGSAAVTSLKVQRLDGTAAASEYLPPGAGPWRGNGGTEFIPQGAGIVKLLSPFAGRSHRGRVFLPYVAENRQANGQLSRVTECDTAWKAFRDACETAGIPMLIASYKLKTSNLVTQVVAETPIATQRRRNKR